MISILSFIPGEVAPSTTIDLSTPSFNFSAPDISIVQEIDGSYEAHLSTVAFSMEAQPLDVHTNMPFNADLSTPSFNIQPVDLVVSIAHLIELNSPYFHTSGVALNIDFSEDIGIALDTPSFNLVPQNVIIESENGYTAELNTVEFDIKSSGFIQFFSNTKVTMDTPSFDILPIDIGVYESPIYLLSTPEFSIQPIDIDTKFDFPTDIFLSTTIFRMRTNRLNMADNYTLTFDTIGGIYGAGGLLVKLGGVNVATVTADGTHEFTVTGADGDDIEFINASLDDFVGDVDNVSLVKK